MKKMVYRYPYKCLSKTIYLENCPNRKCSYFLGKIDTQFSEQRVDKIRRRGGHFALVPRKKLLEYF